MGFIDFLKSIFKKKNENKPAPQPVPATAPTVVQIDPPWLTIAKKEVGVKEFDGQKNNPRILEYFKATSYQPTFEDSWCAAFANWVLKEAGYAGTGKAWAKSFEWYGERLTRPMYGCLCVFWRVSKSSGKGHVGFYMGEDEKNIYVLGGNQSDMVRIAAYPKERLLSYRWPVKP